MRIRFWGTRGSIATPGPGTIHFGGNTSCVEVTMDGGACFMLDCGTGARALGAALMAQARGPLSVTILLSHTHWDHIQGFPFFAPLFVPGNRITVCGPEGSARSLREVLSGQMEFTYFPVDISQLPATVNAAQRRNVPAATAARSRAPRRSTAAIAPETISAAKSVNDGCVMPLIPPCEDRARWTQPARCTLRP